ncbi:hypothetical protein ARAM_002566 [Aspergillus rambellii]|uniref:4-nitrophenylphosphatase n=1 Tax=Aspergillus rambellii TaxID=308745 RepID=A0A0F8X435_9EURO|nr:hypothetical protein ARAM_002566 [Aspergillus rambellii]
MTIPPRYLSGDAASIQEFLAKFDVFLFDCDGLSPRYSKTAPANVPSTTDTLHKMTKLTEEIFSSSYSASIYISRILQLPANKRKVFVIGETGIEQELRSENVPFIGGTDAAFRRDITPEDYKALAAGDSSLLDPEVGVVLVGLDFHINYLKLALAFHYVRRGAVFLATNIDSTLPNSGSLFPGAGSMSAPLIMMLGQEPVSLGKPNQAMMDAIEGKFNFDRSRTCMVGDRVNTDIKFGLEGKLGGTLGVLTGVSSKDDFVAGPIRPMAYLDKLSDLLEGSKSRVAGNEL